VIQIDAPTTVSSFLQRMGRTGRRPNTTPNCLFLTTTDEGLVRSAALLELWTQGYVEPVAAPAKPYHILAQQLVALVLPEHGIGQSDWYRWIESVPAFASMGQATVGDDGRDVLRRIGRRPDTLIYCDSPYHPESRTARRRYKNDTDRWDHWVLCLMANGAAAKVAISGYRSADYNRLLGPWARTERLLINSWSATRRKARECLWTNYQVLERGSPRYVFSERAFRRPSG
jgi:hypothetical protein